LQYLLSFLEGVITFLSPCLLPMLPVYLSYFAGGKEDTGRRAARNAAGFVLGFTAVFVLLGLFAGSLGSLLVRYARIVNLISGFIVILFGLTFLFPDRFALFGGGGMRAHGQGFFQAVLFGVVFSVSWTPCVGAFLGSALILASQQGSAAAGVWMLLAYSAGLGIPFVLSAILIERLKTAFAFVRRHHRAVNIGSAALLIAVGVLMMTGLMGRLAALLSV